MYTCTHTHTLTFNAAGHLKCAQTLEGGVRQRQPPPAMAAATRQSFMSIL